MPKTNPLATRLRLIVFVLASLLILILIAIFLVSRLSTSDNTRSVYIGFWTQGFWNSQTQTLNPSALINTEQEIGKNVAIAHYYDGWTALSEPSTVQNLNEIISHGWQPMLSTNPYFFSGCLSDGTTLYKTIAEGKCDTFLDAVGENLKQVHGKFFLRFAWEMNVNSINWSIQQTGDSPEDFIAAWQRFHTILQQEGATNVEWVFSPQIETQTTIPITSLYPGNTYVNWNGLDGYNWGRTKSWSGWESFNTIFAKSYKDFMKIAPHIPLMVGETSTTDIGGDQAAWYTNMLTEAIPSEFPNISAIVFFNENKTAVEGVNWRIDKTPAMLSAFKTAISNPMYKSHF